MPIMERVYYTRKEACARYGLSSKRLAEAIANDKTLPLIFNGRDQHFPKDLMDDWFNAQALRRQNIHKASKAKRKTGSRRIKAIPKRPAAMVNV